MSFQCLPPNLDSILLTVWEEMAFGDFQDGPHGGHLGYRNDFSNSESLCHSDAFHQVLAQSDQWFGRRRRLKNFKTAAILDIGMEQF